MITPSSASTLTALCYAGFVAIAVLAAPEVEGAEGIGSFMVMDVCTDEADRVLPGLAPGMPGCSRPRDIRTGEALPYRLHSFPDPRKGCKGRLGSIAKENVPTVKNGVTRIVSFYDRGVDRSCPGTKVEDPTFGQRDVGAGEGGSIQWIDADYGFIMGSWSPIALSHWRTPNCRRWPDGSQRFFRGWVIGPAMLPAHGAAPGWGKFETLLENGDPAAVAKGCPESFHSQFTAWWRGDFTFQSGRLLDTFVSEHYSASNDEGTTPGRGKSVERTYWTAEYGLTRWEKWARDDNLHPRNGKSAAVLGAALVRASSCSVPADAPARITPDWETGPLEVGPDPAAPLVAERRRDARTGESHQWILTLCRDYSNVVIEPDGGRVPDWGAALPDAYWKE